ncbi:MAG: MFS transporter [Desulfobacterales bacterium]
MNFDRFKNIGINREVLALSLGRFGDGIGNSILFIIIPLYVADLPAPFFSFSETLRAGILISMFGLVAGLSQPLTGMLIDRLNRRKPFIVGGLLLLCCATVSYNFVHRFYLALAIRALQGFGLALTIPPTLALLNKSSKQASRGGTMGIFSTFRVASLAVGPLLAGLIHDHFGFSAVFYTGAGFILLGALLVQWWVKEVRDLQVKRFQIRDRSLFANGMPALGFATFVMAGSFAMIAPLEQPLNSHLNESPTIFGVAFSALMVARIIVQFPLGRLSDRKGRKLLIVAGLALLAVATLLIGWVTTPWQFITLRIVQGIASGGIAAPVFALAGDLSRAGREGRQMSIVTTGFALGISMGTLFSGILAVYSLALPFLVIGSMGLIAAAMVYRMVPETIQKTRIKNLPQSEN